MTVTRQEEHTHGIENQQIETVETFKHLEFEL